MTFSRSICSAGYTFNIVKAERRGVPMSRKRVLSRLRALLQRSQVHVVSGNTQIMRSNVCTFLNIALLACSKQEAALAGTTQLASALRMSSNLRRHRPARFIYRYYRIALISLSLLCKRVLSVTKISPTGRWSCRPQTSFRPTPLAMEQYMNKTVGCVTQDGRFIVVCCWWDACCCGAMGVRGRRRVGFPLSFETNGRVAPFVVAP